MSTSFQRSTGCVTLSALCLVGACGPADTPPPPPRGVLLISIDSLRADHLSCYGYESPTRPELATSPRIDADLADAGLLFEQAMSTTSWTVPAHKALLSGLPDELHGGSTLGPLPPSRTLLSQALSERGWRTAGFFSGPNLHPWYGFGRGFESYVDCSNAPVESDGMFSLEGEQQRNEMRDVQRASHQGVTSPKLAEAFDSWFSGLGEDEEFFAFVHMWDVHFDYAAPPEFDVFYEDYAGTVDGTNFFELDQLEERPIEDEQRLLSLYDAEIRFSDHHVGLMLDRLRAAGRLDDTLVVLVADHGEEFFEHGHFGHNRTLFEEVVHVPLILRYPPAFEAGTRVDDVASLADVAPTILDLCQVPLPESMWGRSLLAAAGGKLPARDAPLDLRLYREDDPLRGMRGPSHKLVASKAQAPTLYELEADPGELAGRSLGGGLVEDDPRLVSARETWDRLRRLAELLGDDGADGVMPAELQRSIKQAGYTGIGDDQ